MSLLDEIKARTGVDIAGVASARSYGEKAPEGRRPADHFARAVSIVILGRRLLDVPLDLLPRTRQEYTADFHITNAELNRALYDAASLLQSKGHKAYPIPYKEMPGWNLTSRPQWLMRSLPLLMAVPQVRKRVTASLAEDLSYRHMAAEAGLGQIGVSNLLLTPEHGPRVRFVALLTDAGMEPGRPLPEPVCRPERCNYACVRACPAGALHEDGRPTDKAACFRHYIKLGIPGASGVRCGLCVAKCCIP